MVEKKEELQKVLGYKTILLITINSIMGTGIFFLPAVGASISGPSSLIAWAVMSAIAIYTSMCFAELTSMFPKSGGIYEFAKQVYGRTVSFFIGWTSMIVGYITIAMLMIGAISYLLPQTIDAWVVIGFSIVLILVFNYITYRGMETSSTMLVAFSIITLTTIISLTIPGVFTFESSYLSPFFVVGTGGILLTIYLIAETFFGWETATFLAGETIDGEKVVPKALFISTIIISIICFCFVLFSLGAIPWQEFGLSAAPLSDLGLFYYGDGFSTVFALLVYLAIIGSVAGWVVSAPRLLLALAEDKLFIRQLAKISPKYKTPSNAILFQTILIITFIIAGAGSYETLLHMLVPLVLILYSFIVFAVVLLRIRKPELIRHFRVPFAKIGPIILIVLFLTMVLYWSFTDPHAPKLLLLAGSFLSIGIPVYFLVKVYNDSQFSQNMKNATAYYTLLFENVFIPKKIQKEIISYLGDITAKTVLEYGGSVGTLTQHLIVNVGSSGKVITINNSQTELQILQKRLENPKWDSIERIKGELIVLHHHEYHYTLHESITDTVDAVVSIDTLSFLEDPYQILSKLRDVIKIGGRVCFFDFQNFFHLIPNQHWLTTPENIKHVFSECGFQVNVVVQKRLFWSYVYVYGIRSDTPILIV